MTREHPCEHDLTDDHGEAAELRRRLEARSRINPLSALTAAITACEADPHGGKMLLDLDAARAIRDALTAQPVAQGRIWVMFAENPTLGRTIRKWDVTPFEGGIEFRAQSAPVGGEGGA